MEKGLAAERPRYRAFGRQQLNRISQISNLSKDQKLALEAVSAVLPFRVNTYILDELIDWNDIPNDPMYQLTFPQAGMLDSRDFRRMQSLLLSGASASDVQMSARQVQQRMNPHPGDQLQLNVPTIDGERLQGCQHKYRETVLFFPSHGQTCHAYCTYCFRWAQFVGVDELRFADRQVDLLARYLGRHTEASDLLLTGGDPLIMTTRLLRRYVEPLLKPGLEHLSTIRIGSKALSYWPFRFTTDADADDLLRLFEQVRASGRQLAVMAHFSHPRELQTRAVQEAMRRIIDTGAIIRCQAPMVRHVNDNAETWATMWREQVRLGAVPYYTFIERDTGPKHYFEVRLARALRIFTRAYSQVSGLARTVRGPSMSATPGKVLVDGLAEIGGERAFVLKLIQARDPEWVNQVFFARFDSQAVWLDDLQPLTGQAGFFFDRAINEMRHGGWQPSWKQDADDFDLEAEEKVS